MLVMNLLKQHCLVSAFSKYCVAAFLQKCSTSSIQNYCLSNRRYPLLENVTVQHSPLKILYCYFSTQGIHCWNCGVTVSNLFCNNCNSLQKVNEKNNYFELLGLNITYDLKLAELAKKYRQLQSVLHPDKFSNKTTEEKNISAEYSSLINKAYSTLNNPINRGLYLLKLKGNVGGEEMVQMDSTFLMEIMEKNEEVEATFDSEKINELYKVNKETINSLIGNLSKAFNEDDIAAAREILTKLKYYSSIDTKIKQMKEKLGSTD
ncbi:iron-sulfur cluster co-chaperone protein HscB-like protein, mitochondrial [Lycorma delicatula]|uniref:iron-sulfur cluster co-chaperone protein HscB-like protein, mitochondrial n=1 Tax=Lycorma delicatula TaxID=130591 RepID=UPI003F50DC47